MPGAGQYTLLSIIVLCGIFPSHTSANELEQLVTESRKLIANYQFRLQTAYDDAYQSGKPEAIKEVCKKASTAFAAAFSKDGWTIGRTSLEVLNHDNIPDDTEQNILNKFNEKQVAGTETEKLSWYKFTEIANHSEFRYIKGFEMEQRCLSCHSGKENRESSMPRLAVFTVKRIETKNYFPEVFSGEQHKPLPVFEE
jgi:hypothetical protein